MRDGKIDAQNNLIYLHIPKTAGTTVRSIFARQFPKNALCKVPNVIPMETFLALSPEQKRQYRCFFGHMVFGLHEHLAGSSIYISMLRNPVDRIISDYYHAKRNKEHGRYEQINANNWSLADYARFRAEEQGIANTETRFISGQFGLTAGAPFDPMPASALDTAKENIRTRFKAVGLQEQFDTSLILFKQVMGWKNVNYVRKNVGRNRPKNEAEPKETIQLIERLNALDMELYAHVEKLFNSQVDAQRDYFEREARKIQRGQQWYQLAYMGYQRLPKSAQNLAQKLFGN